MRDDSKSSYYSMKRSKIMVINKLRKSILKEGVRGEIIPSKKIFDKLRIRNLFID